MVNTGDPFGFSHMGGSTDETANPYLLSSMRGIGAAGPRRDVPTLRWRADAGAG